SRDPPRLTGGPPLERATFCKAAQPAPMLPHCSQLSYRCVPEFVTLFARWSPNDPFQPHASDQIGALGSDRGPPPRAKTTTLLNDGNRGRCHPGTNRILGVAIAML